ncbi:kinase-like domain-containing protein [Pelagophyceae sp. CCMP2097]|nr:kinase-like domain-containing protein [Pelagophyceae sp. CCMP2097]
MADVDPAGSPRPENGIVTLSDFELLQKVGEGTFGKVMLARKSSNAKLHAIKFIRKEKLLRRGAQARAVTHVIDENKILKVMNHPFVLTLYYSFQDEHRLYLVTQWVGGGDLFQHLERYGAFDESWCVFYGAQLVLALGHVHDAGVVYRDLKPENVLLGLDGYMVLCDFGLAKKVHIPEESDDEADDAGMSPSERGTLGSGTKSPFTARSERNFALGKADCTCEASRLALAELTETPVPAAGAAFPSLGSPRALFRGGRPSSAPDATRPHARDEPQREPASADNTPPAQAAAARKRRRKQARPQPAGTFCGTPLYLALEIVGRQPYGISVDWWAFGCLLVEILTGQPPFVANDLPALMDLIRDGTPCLKGGDRLTPAARGICLSLLVRKPTKRLGCGAGGWRDIQKHAWFDELNWEALLAKKLVAPLVPRDHLLHGSMLLDGGAGKGLVEKNGAGGIRAELTAGFEAFTLAGEEDVRRPSLSLEAVYEDEPQNAPFSPVYGPLQARLSSYDDSLRCGDDAAVATAMLCEAARAGDCEALKRLFSLGARVNAADYDRRTALHLAASEGRAAAVDFLLDRGANPDLADRWGGTALQDAIREQRYAVARNLLARGASGEDRHTGARARVSFDGTAAAAKLCDAACAGDVERLRCMCDAGADVNAGDYDRRTALHLAACEGHTKCTEFLVARGADSTLRDRWGNTALADAMREKHLEVASVLRIAMADVLRAQLLSAQTPVPNAQRLDSAVIRRVSEEDAPLPGYVEPAAVAAYPLIEDVESPQVSPEAAFWPRGLSRGLSARGLSARRPSPQPENCKPATPRGAARSPVANARTPNGARSPNAATRTPSPGGTKLTTGFKPGASGGRSYRVAPDVDPVPDAAPGARHSAPPTVRPAAAAPRKRRASSFDRDASVGCLIS